MAGLLAFAAVGPAEIREMCVEMMGRGLEPTVVEISNLPFAILALTMRYVRTTCHVEHARCSHSPRGFVSSLENAGIERLPALSHVPAAGHFL